MFTYTKEKLSKLRHFMVSTLLMTAVAAQAQEKATPTSPVSDSEDAKSKSTLTVGFGNVAALTLTEKKTEFYDDLTPFFSASTENDKGYFAGAKGTELIIMGADGKITPITATFMLELGKKLGPDEAIVFKAGRECTEGGHVFDHALSYYADASDMGFLGNSSERIVFGYQKGDNFIELGAMGTTGEGFYVIPNPKEASFWTKGQLSLLKQSGVKLWMDGAFRLGNGHKQVLGSANLETPSGGIKVFGNYDFSQNDANLAVRAYKNIRNNWSAVIEAVLHDNKDVFIRAGAGHKGFQVSLEYAKPKQGPQGVNLTTSFYLSQSKKIK